MPSASHLHIIRFLYISSKRPSTRLKHGIAVGGGRSVKSSQNPGSGNSIRAVLGIARFRLLWIGQGTSLLGDYFHFIALPWLVLQITNNNAFALAVVLALAGIPRALFLLIGGAITDRISSRTSAMGTACILTAELPAGLPKVLYMTMIY